eukprot:9503325-Ditylum_brightwellii.AAC.1
MHQPLAYLLQSDPDTMRFHQAMKEPDKEEFVKAIAMKCKQDIKTGRVYKWNARVNVHGRQQQKGVNYWEMYAPVVT